VQTHTALTDEMQDYLEVYHSFSPDAIATVARKIASASVFSEAQAINMALTYLTAQGVDHEAADAFLEWVFDIPVELDYGDL
jgi:hypothetical protein